MILCLKSNSFRLNNIFGMLRVSAPARTHTHHNLLAKNIKRCIHLRRLKTKKDNNMDKRTYDKIIIYTSLLHSIINTKRLCIV